MQTIYTNLNKKSKNKKKTRLQKQIEKENKWLSEKKHKSIPGYASY